jgi:hypothetical protein
MRAKYPLAIALTFLAACGSRQQVLTFPPVDAGQRVSVLEAVSGLREVFNGDNACESIYNFPSYPKERWLADCAQLQSDLGSWQNFRAGFIERCGMPGVVICVDGDATFAKGARILELIWSLDGGRAQLVSIGWRGDAEWIRIPPLVNPDKHWDAPPVPGKRSPEKS